ncbi:PepSY domain-containing protein [Rhodanobacter sp. C01]|uniref:PepSY domain-containing protein n=1 Tax=Rhodanobacter sp. C01 TaxID=1945856 RepID=UPI000986FAFB|nr:PepSY domain-containing protein [Rhodanobacter sp. C01]OOG49090.1 hypothetical protein B0E50_06730 [Rhodanobacter sp. C01]
MSSAHRFLKAARSIHLYLGVFTAPMLLFFAITGGLQTFSLHETTRGSSYKPPAWLASMAQLHKKQTTVMPVRRPRPAETAVPAASADATQARMSSAPNTAPDVRVTAIPSQPAGNTGEPPKKNLLPMKIFFALVSLGLLISVLTGLYMSYRFSRKPLLVSSVLAAGILVPLLLLLF